MDKIELLDRIDKSWNQVNTVLAGLTDKEMLHRQRDDDWSINDLVAHLTFWQQTMVTNVQRVARGETMIMLDGKVDAINAQVYAANRFRPPALVLSEFRLAHQQLMESLQTLTDEDLGDKAQLSLLEKNSLSEYIFSDSAEHYEQHLADMLKALERAKNSQ